MPPRSKLGNKGEDDAVDYLTKKSYSIIERNFYSRGGEIDIIAIHNDTLVFIEVKARTVGSMGRPYEAITYNKLMKMRLVISAYLSTHKIKHGGMRIDVIGIDYESDYKLKCINHYENVTMDDVRY